MAKKERIVGYPAEGLAEKTRSDWAKAAVLTSEEIEAQWRPIPTSRAWWWIGDRVTVNPPKPNADFHMRVDRECSIISAARARIIRE